MEQSIIYNLCMTASRWRVNNTVKEENAGLSVKWQQVYHLGTLLIRCFGVILLSSSTPTFFFFLNLT